MNEKNNQILAVIDKKKTIFVDCFDTLLYRICSPEQVLERWFYMIAEKYEIDYICVKEIWKISKQIKDEPIDELSFKKVAYNMYNRFEYIKSIMHTFEEFYNYILEIYIQIEVSVIRINQPIYTLLKDAKKRKKDICLVSDFYMPRAFFERIFMILGINDLVDKMFISSEVGYRKSSGLLFGEIMKNLNLNASEILMIGDNKISDYKRAREHGIDSYNIKKHDLKKEETLNYKLWNLFEGLLREAPFANNAFSIFLFIRKLLKKVKEKNIKDIYFFSREGEFLKKVFDTFLKDTNLDKKISTHYMLVSRKSTFLPSLNENIKIETFSTLKRSINSISIKDFILTLGMKLEDFSSNYKINTDSEIRNFFESKEFEMLINNELFAERYKVAVIREKKEFKDYLETIGIDANTKNIAIVDIGWKGTIQDNLYNFFEGRLKIEGFYYGLEGESLLNPNNRKYGLVYTDVPIKSRFFGIFSTNHRLLERILQASHGTANYYFGGQCILGELDENENELFEQMKINKEHILQMIHILNVLFKENVCSELQIEKVVAYLHETYLYCYTDRFFAEEKHTENLMLMTFGTNKQYVSYRDILKSIRKMPKVEMINKFLKLGRRIHCKRIDDVVVRGIYCHRKKQFLKLEI
ncbi:HAD family hydrolase [Clostridium sp. TF11-13AC]|uniref:HAD family hydrolase n=1 Tax=Clostridium sp. TF11-13AC TaxID=2293053 RepID=UPI000E492C78|nr:HAD family hydrolase [Clostridium sp. TF11-13AC]RHU44992.1 hypothetical protein DXD12_05165 [Clostridium sp. TF11-13AC]